MPRVLLPRLPFSQHALGKCRGGQMDCGAGWRRTLHDDGWGKMNLHRASAYTLKGNIFKVIFNLRFFKSKFLFENSYNLNCIYVLLNIGYQVQIFTEGKKRSCHYIAETAFCWCSCSLLCLRSLIHEKISFGIEIARERKIEMPGQRGNGRVRYEVRVVKINVSGGLPGGPINEPINASSAIIDLQCALALLLSWVGDTTVPMATGTLILART